MKATFKQFNTLINLPDEELTEERLAEIFGWSDKEKQEKAQEKIKQLQAKKDALKKQQSANATAQMAKKQQIGQTGSAQARTQAISNNTKQNLDATPSNQMRGAQSRAAERDWAAGLTNEGANPVPKITDVAKNFWQPHVTKLIKKETGHSTYFDDVDLVDRKSSKTIMHGAIHPKKEHKVSDLIDQVKKFKAKSE